MAKTAPSRISGQKILGELRLAAKKGDRAALTLALDQMRTLAHSPKYWEKYLTLLRNPLARLVDMLLIKQGETRGPGDGERLAREAAAAGAPLVVAVGGDGTLNEVVNGVRAAGRGTPVGAVLTGRGCDASRNFGVPRDPIAAVRALADGRDRQLDLGRAEWGDGRLRWFTISGGAGFDAAVARRAQSVRMRGTLPYLAAVIASVHLHRPTPAVLELDGVAEPAVPITAVVAAN